MIIKVYQQMFEIFSISEIVHLFFLISKNIKKLLFECKFLIYFQQIYFCSLISFVFLGPNYAKNKYYLFLKLEKHLLSSSSSSSLIIKIIIVKIKIRMFFFVRFFFHKSNS